MHAELIKRAKTKIALKDMMWAVRHPKLTGDMAGHGQIVELHQDVHPEMGVLWHTQTTPLSAQFTPIFLVAPDVLPNIKSIIVSRQANPRSS